MRTREKRLPTNVFMVLMAGNSLVPSASSMNESGMVLGLRMLLCPSFPVKLNPIFSFFFFLINEILLMLYDVVGGILNCVLQMCISLCVCGRGVEKDDIIILVFLFLLVYWLKVNL